MNKLTRAEQRDHLFTCLGMLVDPIRRILDDPNPAKVLPHLRASFKNDLAAFESQFGAFCKIGEYVYDKEYNDLRNIVFTLPGLLNVATEQGSSGNNNYKTTLAELIQHAESAIRRIPCEDPAIIFPAKSPFQTYLHIRALCKGAKTSVMLFDPYLDADVFYRYLSAVSANVPIVVITSIKQVNPNATAPENIYLRNSVLAISELMAEERKQNGYQFRVSAKLSNDPNAPQSQHDRHLVIDDTLYCVGGSLKDAAHRSPLTFSSMPVTPNVKTELDNIATSAVEWFGPNEPKHRRA